MKLTIQMSGFRCYIDRSSLMVKTDQTECETTAEPNEAIDGPDSGYDIVVDDDTVSHELFNNQQGKQYIHIGDFQRKAY